jgi:NAD(P)-dependent dehydrogenase (short-subunit alcohol dehydrogenase family)
MNEGKQRIIVVGGSSGMGLALAQKAQRRGADVVVVGRSRERLARLAESGVRTIAADITREADVEQLFAEVGAFDHLAATAVDAYYGPIRALDLAGARRTIDSKLNAALLLAKHGAGRIRPGGSITFTAGAASERPAPSGSVIAAVNGALEALARALAVELAPLRVNALSPGWVDTPLWDQLAGDQKAERFVQMGRRLPVGRIGRAEEIADAFLFLMDNGFTTGSVLRVDGGHRLM